MKQKQQKTREIFQNIDKRNLFILLKKMLKQNSIAKRIHRVETKSRKSDRFIFGNFLYLNNNQVMYSFERKKEGGESDHKNEIGNLQVNSNFTSSSKQDLKEVYMCSCGKQYQSFPAVYLHFRSKHDIKLSTKPTERRKIVQIEGDIKKITYILELADEQSNETPENALLTDQQAPMKKSQSSWPDAEKTEACIRKYLNFCSFETSNVYEKFLKFLTLQYQEHLYSQNSPALHKIPYFLNDFALYYLPKQYEQITIGSPKWKKCCQELKSFCDWLRKEKYTQLMVIYDDL